MLIVNIILAFVMFGVALGIKPQIFKDVFKKPKSVLTGIFLQCDQSCFDEETAALVKQGINPIWFDGVCLSSSAEESKQKIVKQYEENLDKLEQAQAAEAKAKAALKKAQENPNIPESVMEQLRTEAEAKAAEEATEEIRKKLSIAENALMESERARLEADAKAKDARDKLAAAQNSAKIQNPNLMAINVLGKQTIITAWNTIQGHRMKAVEADPANAAAIDAFLKKVLDAMSASVADG